MKFRLFIQAVLVSVVASGTPVIGVALVLLSKWRVVAVRAVDTDDFMTCNYTPLPHRVLGRIAARITNEIREVSRVVYDITGKPPATVEWE